MDDLGLFVGWVFLCIAFWSCCLPQVSALDMSVNGVFFLGSSLVVWSCSLVTADVAYFLELLMVGSVWAACFGLHGFLGGGVDG